MLELSDRAFEIAIIIMLKDLVERWITHMNICKIFQRMDTINRVKWKCYKTKAQYQWLRLILMELTEKMWTSWWKESEKLR